MMHPIAWQQQSKVPRCVGAILDALRFDAMHFDGARIEWPAASPEEWDRAIYYLHRNQLTLLVRHVCGRNLPPHLQVRFAEFYEANVVRLRHLRASTREVLSELQRAGIEAVLLKGFARPEEFVPDPEARMHYDVDLYCPQAAREAAAVLRGIGYLPVPGTGSDASGHLAPLARPASWKWRDDFFDIETPVHVELHEVLWVPQIECFSFSGLEDFWTRREQDDHTVLSRHDALAYRCIHLLRHLLRGDLRAAGVYEIAWFLHRTYQDDEFWKTWQSLHSKDLQRGQAVCFALAQRWFGCRMHATPSGSVASLTEAVSHWMERHAASPVESFFKPAKDELTLHFALLDSSAAKCRVALRRLLPVRHTGRLWESRPEYLLRLGARALYHARALVPALSRLLMIRR